MPASIRVVVEDSPVHRRDLVAVLEAVPRSLPVQALGPAISEAVRRAAVR